MKRTILLTAILAAGCSSMSPAERTWQSLHLVDTLQTVQLARHSECYREANPLTRAIIGRHPSGAEVVAWGIAFGIAHNAVSRRLEERGPRWALRAWNWTRITAKGATVASNARAGLGPFGAEGC